MYQEAINILKKLKELGYDAYIVGGYARDKYLKIDSLDIDICTNATPDIISKYFNIDKQYERYGVSIVKIDNYLFEVTTFRKDYYDNNRYPYKVEFVNTLKEDLIRRDFTINTLCIDSDENYIDLMNSIDDINNRIIKSIKEPNESLNEDPLRILRAIRFMGNLDFKLDQSLEKAIIDNKHLLNNLSNDRKELEISKMNKKSLDYLKSLNS